MNDHDLKEEEESEGCVEKEDDDDHRDKYPNTFLKRPWKLL
jgi:hypothetical protein